MITTNPNELLHAYCLNECLRVYKTEYTVVAYDMWLQHFDPTISLEQFLIGWYEIRADITTHAIPTGYMIKFKVPAYGLSKTRFISIIHFINI